MVMFCCVIDRSFIAFTARHFVRFSFVVHLLFSLNSRLPQILNPHKNTIQLHLYVFFSLSLKVVHFLSFFVILLQDQLYLAHTHNN